MTDTTQGEQQPSAAELPVPTPRPGSAAERGVDLETVFRDERLDAGRDSGKDFDSAASAAEHLRKQRKSTQANIDYHDAENHIDEIPWTTDGKTPAESSATLSDTKQLSENLNTYRDRRQAQAETYLTANYGDAEQQGAVAADYQLTEQQQAQEQVRQQQAEAQLQAHAEALQQIDEARRLQSAYAAQIQTAAQQFASAQNTEFSDIRTHQDILNLAQTDPARHARFMDLNARYSEAYAEYQRVAQAQQQIAAVDEQQRVQAANAWRAEQDEQFARAHPEWQNPAVKEREQRQVFEYLESRGLSMQQIEHLYNNDPNFRSAAGQNVLLDATRYYSAQKRMAQVRAKPVPPVQRPGVSRDRAWVDEDRLRALGDQLGKSGSTRDAARLLIERRRASR